MAIDCFAGCGGMSLGFKQAGFDVVGAIEIDPFACNVYAMNHPDTHLWREDIQNITASRILKTIGLKRGQLDLLGGCPPCQGFSTLRTYNGSKRVRDKRNELIFDYQRLVLGLKPKTIMLENVPALIKDRRFTEFSQMLEAAGYHVKSGILNVADFGVPQRRWRVVLLASRVSPVRFGRKSSRIKTVRDAIGSMPKPGKSRDSLHNIPENRSEQVKERIRGIPRDGGSRSSLPKHLTLDCHKNSDGFKDVYGRMSWDKPAPTITTGCFNPSKGRFLHPSENRAITMREAALLQSFPKSYIFPATIGKVHIAALIGNALPPSFIKRHAKQLLRESILNNRT